MGKRKEVFKVKGRIDKWYEQRIRGELSRVDDIIFGLSLQELTIAVLIVWLLWVITKKMIKMAIITVVLIVLWFIVKPYLASLF